MTSLPVPAPPVPGTAVRRWPPLHSSARALALATAARADPRLWVVLVEDSRRLDELRRELEFFAGADLPVMQLPDWEVLPYDRYSPLPDLVSERIATLAKLPGLRQGLLLVSAETLLQRLPPVPYIAGRAFDLATGERFSMARVSEQLAAAGYSHVAQVGVPGEFALRGSLFDVFPMGYAQPLRIDLFDDTIDSIRHFDPDTQRSLEALPRVRLLPAREVPLDEDSVRDFRRRYRTRFEGDPTRSEIYRGVRHNIAPPGIACWRWLQSSERASPPCGRASWCGTNTCAITSSTRCLIHQRCTSRPNTRSSCGRVRRAWSSRGSSRPAMQAMAAFTPGRAKCC